MTHAQATDLAQRLIRSGDAPQARVVKSGEEWAVEIVEWPGYPSDNDLAEEVAEAFEEGRRFEELAAQFTAAALPAFIEERDDNIDGPVVLAFRMGVAQAVYFMKNIGKERP